MICPAFVCLSVCLTDCQQLYVKKLLNGSSRKFYHRCICAQERTEKILQVTLFRIRIQNFSNDSSTWRDGAFLHNLAYISGEWSDFLEIFITAVSMDREIPALFWKQSGYRVCFWIRTAAPDHTLLGGRMRSLTALVLGSAANCQGRSLNRVLAPFQTTSHDSWKRVFLFLKLSWDHFGGTSTGGQRVLTLIFLPNGLTYIHKGHGR